MKDKKILIVGGAGFIGSHLAEAISAQGAHVFVADDFSLGKMENVSFLPDDKVLYVDVSFLGNTECLFSLWGKFDLVYNLAVKPLPHSLEYPYDNVSQNINIVTNLCELQTRGAFERMIHFSSSEVYGTCITAPMDENHPLSPTTPYAASKAAGDFICLSYVKTFGSEISIIRPFNNYGPKQNDASYAGVIPVTINRIKKGFLPQITGDGKQTRDYIYVSDTVRAAILLGKAIIETPEKVVGEVFNVASGHDIEIGWLVRKIAEIMNFRGYRVAYDFQKGEYKSIQMPDRRGDVRRHISNPLKAKDVLGFFHKTGMAEGLERTVDWYLKEN